MKAEKELQYKAVTCIQRGIRGVKHRKLIERKSMTAGISEELGRQGDDVDIDLQKLKELLKPEIRRQVESANQIYKPQCDDENLAERLIRCAKRVKLSDTMCHYTSLEHSVSVMDTLYGRKSLNGRKLPFRPAALYPSDIDNGDEDAICFGLDKVDDICLPDGEQSVKFIFDFQAFLEKAKASPIDNMFFKAKDLGCPSDKRDKTEFFESGNEKYYFQHGPAEFEFLPWVSHQRVRHIDFNVMNDGGKILHSTTLPKFGLISDNISDLQAILTMNFFKYIDQIAKENPELVQGFYNSLEGLTDDELTSKLESIGRSMSQQAEINFHGALRFPLEFLQSIEIFDGKTSRHKIDISDLKSMDSEAMKTYLEAHCPILLNSERFMSFITKPVDQAVVDTGNLQGAGSVCSL